MRVGSWLNAAEYEKNDDDAKDKTQSPGRSIAPISTMRPTGQGSEQRQNQNHDQYGSKHVWLLDDEIVKVQPVAKLHPMKRYMEMLMAMPTLG